MICWGLGGFGLGLTGILEVNTKEDMGAHAALILMWGANLASQPNTARHLTAARQGFGTTPYMSYEQAIDAKSADAQSCLDT